jgi:hypothetical protein
VGCGQDGQVRNFSFERHLVVLTCPTLINLDKIFSMINGARFSLALSVLFLFACTPLQTVRPLPEFVALAIKPGDQIELVTKTGERLQFRANQVDEQSIGSPDHLILLEDIHKLYVRSENRPEYPCGGERALGCSVPGKVKSADLLISGAASAVGGALESVVDLLGGDWHSRFEEHFYDACVQHDFCYRHGYKTYGHEKEHCDAEFYANMLESCNSADLACKTAAKEFNWAVREHAEEGAYQVESSTHCQYDGPVSNFKPKGSSSNSDSMSGSAKRFQ